jgi:hypothetical protein
VCAVAFGLTAGCSGTSQDNDPQTGSEPVSVPEFSGKADNYISSNASEFELSGTTQADLPEDFADQQGDQRQETIAEAVDDRLSTVTGELKSHVEDRVDEANGGASDEEDKEYFMYARSGNEETLERNVVDGEYVEADFEWELVGSQDLVQVLVGEDDQARSFDIEVDGVDSETVTRTIEVAPSDSTDAFPKYDELFADGVYDIGLHFGGDYNEERYDIEMAKWAVQKLQEDGWANPEVDSYEDLTMESPPFTKQMTIEGRQVEARVYLYHPEAHPEGEQEVMTEKLEESFAERDVVIYNGHAGPGAGFILDYEPRHEVEPAEFDELPMADKYQIFVVNGCETYASYVPDLMENDDKTFENADILTTVNKTPIGSFDDVTYRFINWLTYTDRQGRHFPMTWNTILQGVNEGNRSDAHYGIHGIDQDPTLNPHQSEGVACRSCSSQGQCQAGGNYCLRMNGGTSCGVACATDEACGEGSKCVPITDDPDKFYIPKQCVPTDRQCR